MTSAAFMPVNPASKPFRELAVKLFHAGGFFLDGSPFSGLNRMALDYAEAKINKI